MSAVWHIEMLGELRVVGADSTLTRFLTSKVSGLLAYLALRLETAQPRELLAERFWPDCDPEAARSSLRQALSSLRRMLEPSNIPSGSVVVADRQSVRLNPDAVTTDVVEFQRLVHAGKAEAIPEKRAALLSAAIKLYRGELLPGCYEDWAVREAQRLSACYLEALHLLANAQERVGCLADALGTARQGVIVDPYDEAGYRRLMRLQAAYGQAGAAMETYRDLERLMRNEFGAAPSEETRRLAIALRILPADTMLKTGEIGKEGAPSSGIARLPQPTPDPAAMRSVSPPLPSSFAPDLPMPRALPPLLNRYWGREAECAQLEALLHPIENERREMKGGGPFYPLSSSTDRLRLVTLTGMGGMGKTRLALEVAQRLASIRSRMVVFVPLAEVADTSKIGEAIARALKLPSTTDWEPLEAVAAFLNGKNALLVLDNLEHLLGSADNADTISRSSDASDSVAATVLYLLERVPDLVCLCTSRQRLEVRGEREFRLAPLPESEAICLYVDRARAARPDFALTSRNAEPVRELCRRLEGLPLAIELAAAWVRTLPPRAMLARLVNLLDLPETRERNIPARQRSLRAVLDWSFALLTPAQQRFFSRFSVFVGDATLAVAAEVCEEPDALQLLADLQAASLMGSREEGGEDRAACEGVEEEKEDGSASRFYFSETIRAYSAERLRESGEEDLARARHAAVFLALSERAYSHLKDRKQTCWLDILERERANFCAAMDWYAAQPEGGNALVALAKAMCELWVVRGPITEGRRYVALALAHPSAHRHTRERALTLNNSGILANLQSDDAAAHEAFQQCLALWEALGDDSGIGGCLINLGVLLLEQGRLEEANDCYLRAQQLFHESKDVAREVIALNNLGMVAQKQNNYRQARSLFMEALDLLQPGAPSSALALVWTSLSTLNRAEGDEAAAQQMLEQALAIQRSLGDHSGIVVTLGNLGQVVRERQDYAAANAYFREALSISADMGNLRLIVHLIGDVAILDLYQDEAVRAATLFGAFETLLPASGLNLSPEDKEMLAKEKKRVEACLGSAKYHAVLSKGRALTHEQAVAYALSHAPAS